MGFVKRNVELEEWLDSMRVEWSFLSDSEYKKILKQLGSFIETGEYSLYSGDDAFSMVESQLPLNGYIFSAPKNKYFSVYESGGENSTFGYRVKGLGYLVREVINKIECVVTNDNLSFACMFNHEWQAHCPEQYYEKTHNKCN